MKINNASQYDTKALKRILLLTWDTLFESLSKTQQPGARDNTVINIRKGQKHCRWKMDRSVPNIVTLTVPALNGSEFVTLLRQAHGGEQHDGGTGLAARHVALMMQQAMYYMWGWNRPNGKKNTLVRAVEEKLVRELPPYVAIRVIKPKAEKPRPDRSQVKLQKAVEMERKWTTKLKLATTKVKRARKLVRYYTKEIAKRASTQEPS